MLLGFDDLGIALAFYANLIAVSIGVIYGLINFNKGDDCDVKLERETVPSDHCNQEQE